MTQLVFKTQPGSWHLKNTGTGKCSPQSGVMVKKEGVQTTELGGRPNSHSGGWAPPQEESWRPSQSED